MAPDLNSLAAAASPRRSSAVTTPHPTSPSARSPSFSLAAAASINAGIQSNSRRSSLSLSREASQTSTPSLGATRQQNSMRINLNDPGLPGPGELVASEQRRSGSTPEHASPVAIPRASPRFQLGTPAVIGTADPHHHRTPSLGELHQELEQEQEAHVNRLLTMIRQQQNQLQQLQSASPTQASQSAIDTEVTTPQSERNVIFTSLPPQQPSSARTHSPNTPRRPSRQSSRTSSYRSRHSSRDYSPNLRPMSGLQLGPVPGYDEGSRDESAFYQAETQTLTRENQMLRVRIKELEHRLAEKNQAAPGAPAVHSHLVEGAEWAPQAE